MINRFDINPKKYMGKGIDRYVQGETLKECKQNVTKKCHFGELNCWFHHETEINKTENKKIARLRQAAIAI